MIVNCDCAFGCVHLSCFHSDLNYLLCVLRRELHADSPVGGFTQHLDGCVLAFRVMKKKPGHGLAPFIVFYTESISFSPVFS